MIGSVAPIAQRRLRTMGRRHWRCCGADQAKLSGVARRIDAAIPSAKSTGSRVHEINDASSDRRYEI
jgi:hypothetical protein